MIMKCIEAKSKSYSAIFQIWMCPPYSGKFYTDVMLKMLLRPICAERVANVNAVSSGPGPFHPFTLLDGFNG
jgi:hypothetical protein